MAGAGDCFLIETNHDKDGTIIRHLFVVLLDPEEHTKKTIIVPVDTLRSPKQDQTTILQPGDHEFIRSRSFINYRLAKIRSVTFIDDMIASRKAKNKDPMRPEILERIIEGIRKSDHTPQEVLEMYSYYMIRKIKK